MSLILDALSRAEREKRSGEKGTAPDLLSQPQHAAVVPSRRRVLLGVGAILLLLVLASVLYRSIRDAGNPAAPGPRVATETPGAAPRAAVDPALAAANGRSESAPAPADRASALVPDRSQPKPAAESGSPEPVVASESPAPPAESGSLEPASVSPAPVLKSRGRESVTESGPPAPDADVQALYAQAPLPGASATADEAAAALGRATPEPAAPAPEVAESAVEETVDLEQVLREVRVAAANDGLAPHPVPLLADLSKQFRDRVPTLVYLRHDFDASGRSTVLINGETLRRGQRTRGVELREILADSIILRFDGTDFRLRALNSWVNL